MLEGEDRSWYDSRRWTDFRDCMKYSAPDRACQEGAESRFLARFFVNVVD